MLFDTKIKSMFLICTLNRLYFGCHYFAINLHARTYTKNNKRQL